MIKKLYDLWNLSGFVVVLLND